MKKVLAEMVIKWYDRGYTADEIARLLTQCNPQEINLIIQQHEKEKRK